MRKNFLKNPLTLAETFANLGQVKKAREHLEAALEMLPNSNQKEAIDKMMLGLTDPENVAP